MRGFAISAVPPQFSSFEAADELARSCVQMSLAIEATVHRHPNLIKAFPHLEKFTERWRQILPAGHLPRLLRLQRSCRESLGQLAKCWGYNQPQWLKVYLPILGYRKSDEDFCEDFFQKWEVRNNVLLEICQRATLVGNVDALKIAWPYLPSSALKFCGNLKNGEEGWGYLRFVHFEDSLPAARLIQRERWIEVEHSCFAHSFGKSAARALSHISPAYNCSIPIPIIEPAAQRVLFATWIRSGAKTPSELIARDLEKLTGEMLATGNFGFEVFAQMQSALTPLQMVPESHLQYFPTHLINWRLIQAPPPQEATLHQLHKGLLKESAAKEDPQRCRQLSSPLKSLADLLYGLEDMAHELKSFCLRFLDEMEGGLKSRRDLQNFIETLEIDQAEIYLESSPKIVQNALGTILLSALIAYLYQVQLHVGGIFKAPEASVLLHLHVLREQLDLLGLKDLQWRQCHVANDSIFVLSLIFNPQCPWRGQLFMRERRVNVKGCSDLQGNARFQQGEVPHTRGIMYFSRREHATLEKAPEDPSAPPLEQEDEDKLCALHDALAKPHNQTPYLSSTLPPRTLTAR